MMKVTDIFHVVTLSDIIELFTNPIFPEQLWYLPIVVLVILGLAALVDAWSGRIPNVLIVIGLAVTIFFSAAYEGWGVGFGRALMALIAFFLLKGANEFYLNLCSKDAFGLGDVKWTAIVAAAFGFPTVFWSWVIGAWLGLLWLGLRMALGVIWPAVKPEGYVHFAPFLLIGVLTKMYAFPILFP